VTQELQMNFEQKDPKGVTMKKGVIPIIVKILGFLESETERRALLQFRTIKKEGEVIREEPIFSGWVKPLGGELPTDNANYFLAVPQQPIPQQTVPS